MLFNVLIYKYHKQDATLQDHGIYLQRLRTSRRISDSRIHCEKADFCTTTFITYASM
jgi:hypothetical protein